MKVAVYTCITAGYDQLVRPAQPCSALDFHCFTDGSVHAVAPWRMHLLDAVRDPKSLNRHVKMLPHRYDELAEYDLTIYVDGSVRVIGDMNEFANECLRAPAELQLFDHPFRSCAYEEARVCASVGHAPTADIESQMDIYRAAGFPEGQGLFEANVIVRRPTAAVGRTMELWWEEFESTGSKRDQLSLTYAAWVTGVSIESLGPSDPRFGHRYFRLDGHRPSIRRRLQAAATKWRNRATLWRCAERPW